MTNIQSSMESAVERQVVARPRHPLLWALAQGTGIGLLLAPVRYWQPAVFPWALLVGLTVALAVVAVIDETTRRIPNTHTALLLAAGAVLTIQTAVLNSPTAALTSVAAAAGVAVFYGIGAALHWWGMGDAKLAGTTTLLVATIAGPLAAYLVPVAIVISAARILIRQLRGLPTTHPHGAAIAAGAILVLLLAALSGR
ncbi:prepilin peptidase [Microbacterium xylanilyticum]